MLRHVLAILSLIALAAIGGWLIVPGEREQWTMLIRDGRNQEALRMLEARYAQGLHDTEATLQLYGLLMGFAEVERATKVIEQLGSEHPRNAAILALLAKHYADTQNRAAETRALDQLYAVAPTRELARQLLARYRLQGSYADEERLLRSMTAGSMAGADDSERLGLMLAARGDLEGARTALARFDELADPRRTGGRYALFDILLQLGEDDEAVTRAAVWIGHWQYGVARHSPAANRSAAGVTRIMQTVDRIVSRKIDCMALSGRLADAGNGVMPDCEATFGEIEGRDDGEDTVASQRAMTGARGSLR